MNRAEFYLELEELLELRKGTLGGNEALETIQEWDSVAVISFLALVDGKYGRTLEPKKIQACQTVNDLALLIENTQPD